MGRAVNRKKSVLILNRRTVDMTRYYLEMGVESGVTKDDVTCISKQACVLYPYFHLCTFQPWSPLACILHKTAHTFPLRRGEYQVV